MHRWAIVCLLLLPAVFIPFRTSSAQAGWLEKKSRNYELRTQCDEKIADEILGRMEVMFKAYKAAYKHRKKLDQTPKIVVYANRQEFLRAGAPAGAGAYYNPNTKELVGYWNARNTEEFWNFFFHEGTHQFFDLAFPGFFESGDIPMWFSEGLADCFGASKMMDDGRILINQLSSFLAEGRTRTIQRAVRSGRFVPIKQLLELGQPQFMANASLHYAQSWSLCHFFWNYPNFEGDKGEYKFVVVKLVEAFKTGKKKKEAYEDAFKTRRGQLDMDVIEAQWKEWVMKIRN